MPINKKKLISAFVYNITVIAFLIFFAEILVRTGFPDILPQGTDGQLFADSMYHHSPGLRPFSKGLSNGKTVEIDRHGFRKFSTPIDSLKKSWLFLGDSVTMGIGAEADSTFAGIIHNRLDSLNVLNPSLIGYSATDYQNVFNYFVAEKTYNFNISRVLLLYCLNDLYFAKRDIFVPGGLMRYFLGDFLHYLRVHSRLYIFLKNSISDRSKAYYEFDEQFYAEDKQDLTLVLEVILQIGQGCAQRGIKFEIILMPYEYQFRNKKLLLDRPQELLTEKLQARGIRVLDPLKCFVESKQSSKTFYLYADGIHFSAAGHRQVAEFILEHAGK